MADLKLSDLKIARDLDWSPDSLNDLTGKVAIVTGANSLSSIGGNIAHQLALKGARVYIGARNLAKAKAGIEEILEQSPSISASSLKPFVAAVDDFASVKAAADAFLKTETRLDILVNNAGIFPLSLEYDQYGVNKVMATNHLGPFLLTTMLLPVLKSTSDASPNSDVRIINVSSGVIDVLPPGHSFSSLEAWNNDFGGEKNPLRFLHRYAYSKLANVLFTKELQRRLSQEGSRILVAAVHPGVVATPGTKHVFGADSAEYRACITAYEGALTEVWCAAHPEVREKEETFKGAFFVPYGQAREVTGLAVDEGEAGRLWELSERILTGLDKD
ncbi:NAD(P)-binding protein [Karstenula rhodostoma CBS 690.94]|uniref:NAD(P)-binding protein n=1 Tax=Karstenula rhodostoma CBS 690.94 TaxID=1392251 RepID=A0A9P4P6U9_9PLEO|nr:NAD(P)-binding protein [Karstenula rhodostoma CBS 690.94]